MNPIKAHAHACFISATLKSGLALFFVIPLLCALPSNADAQVRKGSHVRERPVRLPRRPTTHHEREPMRRPPRAKGAPRSSEAGAARPRPKLRSHPSTREMSPPVGEVRRPRAGSAASPVDHGRPPATWENVKIWTTGKQLEERGVSFPYRKAEAYNNLEKRARSFSLSEASSSRSRSNSIEYDKIPGELRGVMPSPRSMPVPGDKPRLIRAGSSTNVGEYAAAPPRRSEYSAMPGTPDIRYVQRVHGYDQIPPELKQNPNR